MDSDNRDRVIAFFSKKLSQAEQNYSANDRELLGLIYFLERFRCYLEGSEFEVISDNQVLKSFFTKPKLSRKEARWLETLGNFGIFPISLKPGKIHVLGDTLSRAPHAKTNQLEILHIDLECITKGYESDKLFGPIVKYLKGEIISNKYQQNKMRNISNMFHFDGKRLLYNGKICVPKSAIADVLSLAHDAKTAGHFGFLKTMSRLKNFHWKYKARDVKSYIQGCLVCQQKKDYIGKSYWIPQVSRFRRGGGDPLPVILLLSFRRRKMDLIL